MSSKLFPRPRPQGRGGPYVPELKHMRPPAEHVQIKVVQDPSKP